MSYKLSELIEKDYNGQLKKARKIHDRVDEDIQETVSISVDNILQVVNRHGYDNMTALFDCLEFGRLSGYKQALEELKKILRDGEEFEYFKRRDAVTFILKAFEDYQIN